MSAEGFPNPTNQGMDNNQDLNMIDVTQQAAETARLRLEQSAAEASDGTLSAAKASIGNEGNEWYSGSVGQIGTIAPEVERTDDGSFSITEHTASRSSSGNVAKTTVKNAPAKGLLTKKPDMEEAVPIRVSEVKSKTEGWLEGIGDPNQGATFKEAVKGNFRYVDREVETRVNDDGTTEIITVQRSTAPDGSNPREMILKHTAETPSMPAIRTGEAIAKRTVEAQPGMGTDKKDEKVKPRIDPEAIKRVEELRASRAK